MAKAQTATQETAGQDMAWLQALEEKVHTAAARLRELREENAGLRRKIEELEERLAARTADAADGWAGEREEIRGRVERLVEHLEELL